MLYMVFQLIINSSLQDQPTFQYDSTGKITGYKTKAGADTVFPFSGEASYTDAVLMSLQHKIRIGGVGKYSTGNMGGYYYENLDFSDIQSIAFQVTNIKNYAPYNYPSLQIYIIDGDGNSKGKLFNMYNTTSYNGVIDTSTLKTVKSFGIGWFASDSYLGESYFQITDIVKV